VARVEVNILLVFLYWVGVTLYPRPFVSDIAILVLKRDVKQQLTNYSSDVTTVIILYLKS